MREIKTMINSFGCGFSEGYGNDDIREARYDKDYSDDGCRCGRQPH